MGLGTVALGKHYPCSGGSTGPRRSFPPAQNREVTWGHCNGRGEAAEQLHRPPPVAQVSPSKAFSALCVAEPGEKLSELVPGHPAHLQAPPPPSAGPAPPHPRGHPVWVSHLFQPLGLHHHHPGSAKLQAKIQTPAASLGVPRATLTQTSWLQIWGSLWTPTGLIIR